MGIESLRAITAEPFSYDLLDAYPSLPGWYIGVQGGIKVAEDFFSGVQQTEKSIADIEIKVPTFVRDLRIISAYLPAPVKKLRRLLPGRALSPAQLLPGMGLAQLSVYEYKDTDLGSYNDFSVVIPLNSPDFPKLPLYNLMKSRGAGEVYYFLIHRGPNSEVMAHIYRDYFLFPEFQSTIDINEGGDWVTCEVKEDGELICRVRGRKLPVETTPEKSAEKIEILVHTPQHQQAQRAVINFLQNATTRNSSDAEVTLGSSHPIAVELSEILKSVKPRMYTYAPSCQCIVYGP
jgi:hypothetical protein